MKEHNEIKPPVWATRLLIWYCKPELLEDLQGDLNEYFQRNIKASGVRKSKLIYVIDVFKFFRLYTIRKPELINLLINWIMIGSYIKTSGRNIVRNKLFSTINIMGLAISMSVGLVMIGVLSDIFSYDKFHKNHENIYRINSLYDVHQDNNNFNAMLATTSPKAARAIKQGFANVDHVAILRNGFSDVIRTDDKSIPLSGLYANEDFFEVFSFEFIQGNCSSALKEPFSIVLTERSALKLFNSVDVLGKNVSFKKGKQYTITGVVKEAPIFSHIKFDLLESLSTLEVEQSDSKNELAWDNIWNTYVYVLLPTQVNKEAFKSTLEKLSEKENRSLKNVKVGLTIEPLDGIMYSNNIGNQIGQVMGSSSLWIFGALTAVVILSACFNYTNLSIARSIKRSREVGVRKVIGASKKHIISQFVVEAMIISLVAFLFALILFIFLRPYFLSLEPSLGQILKLSLSFRLIIFFLLFSILIGILAGCFPAFFFSKMNAIQVLKDQLSYRLNGKLMLRKVLIVFQYCISIIFITFSIVIYQQYKHYVAFDLGYKTENILNVSTQGNKADILKEEFSKLPEVKEISKSFMVTSVGDSWITAMKYANPDDSIGVGYNKIDENYLPLHEHKLMAGENFSYKSEDALETEVIVNLEVLKRFDIAKRDPEKAIGEVVKVDGKDMRIIGVMKDFPYIRANAKNSQKEVVFRYLSGNAPMLNIKIQSSDLVATMEKLEAIWKNHDSVNPFHAKFYEEQLEEGYAGLKASVKMAGFLAFLAICIASIGLLGMVVFTTETRLKEISIRKVLGASEGTLLYLLGKGFVLLLAIATVISMPLMILFFEKIAFPELANHAPLSIPEMFLGVLGILVVALIMIGSQTLKVARTNPADVLKIE